VDGWAPTAVSSTHGADGSIPARLTRISRRTVNDLRYLTTPTARRNRTDGAPSASVVGAQELDRNEAVRSANAETAAVHEQRLRQTRLAND
jgi:hypothetical protein